MIKGFFLFIFGVFVDARTFWTKLSKEYRPIFGRVGLCKKRKSRHMDVCSANIALPDTRYCTKCRLEQEKHVQVLLSLRQAGQDGRVLSNVPGDHRVKLDNASIKLIHRDGNGSQNIFRSYRDAVVQGKSPSAENRVWPPQEKLVQTTEVAAS